MPAGLEKIPPTWSTSVSVKDAGPEATKTVTDAEAVCPNGTLEVESLTVTVYVVVVLGVAMGLAVLALSKEEPVHEKVYGIAPPVTFVWSREECPRSIVVGMAITETFNGKTVLTTISPKHG